MKKQSLIFAVTAALLASIAIPSSASAVEAPPTATEVKAVESFDSAAINWTVTSGKATVGSSMDSLAGGEALEIAYDVSAGDAYISTSATPEGFSSTSIYSSLQLDLKGDGTWNTVYLVLTDRSGEVYFYRVDAMGYKTWKTVTVDLTKPPTAVSVGNKNSVIDAPLALSRIGVVRNGTATPKGTFLIDNIRAVGDGWTQPAAANPAGQKNFVPSAGQTSTISFKAGTPGDYKLELKDQGGHTRTFTGSAATAKTISLKWDGKGDGPEYLAGAINGVLSYDKTPTGSLDTATVVKGGTAFLTGIAARMKASVSSPVGINGSLVNNDMALGDRQAKLMEDAYVNYDRESFEWKLLEPKKGVFSWGHIDQAVATADARNISLIGRLLYTAPWASSAPAGTPAADLPYYPPTNLSDYTAYVKAVVHRYKDSVKVWEVWNEVNTPQYWKPAPDAAAFAEMMKVTYATIKAEDPTATVVAAGLAGFDYGYMERFRAAGGMGTFDGLGVHTFVNGAPEASMTSTWLNGAEAYLAKYAPGKKLWITELAWSTCEASTICVPVTEEQQAQYLEQSYIDAAARGVKAITWWNLIEFGNSTSRLDNYGLVEKTWRTKPAYEALKTFGKAMYGATVVGKAAPTVDGKSVVIDPLNTAAGFKSYNISGGKSVLTTSTTQKHGTTAGGVLNYNFSGTSKGVELQTALKVPGTPSALSLWAYGDKSNSPIYMKFQDAAGKNFQALIGHAGDSKWKRLTFYLDGMAQDYTGPADRKITYPITVKSVFVYKATFTKQETGTIYLDDLSAHYGAPTRGIVLNDRAGETQVLYNHNGSTAALPVPDATVTLTKPDRSTEVIKGSTTTVNLPLLPTPTYAKSSLGVSAASSKATAPVSVLWSAGDNTKAAIQVYAKNGAAVRTIKAATIFDAGARADVWDGKNAAGAVAPAGEYKFRITFYDANGQSTFSEKPFTRIN